MVSGTFFYTSLVEIVVVQRLGSGGMKATTTNYSNVIVIITGLAAFMS
jgi:hypothetical protein